MTASPDAGVIVTVGKDVYPEPAEPTAIAVMEPPDTVAVTTACVPPMAFGGPTVTVGAAAVKSYPLPELVISTLANP